MLPALPLPVSHQFLLSVQGTDALCYSLTPEDKQDDDGHWLSAEFSDGWNIRVRRAGTGRCYSFENAQSMFTNLYKYVHGPERLQVWSPLHLPLSLILSPTKR